MSLPELANDLDLRLIHPDGEHTTEGRLIYGISRMELGLEGTFSGSLLGLLKYAQEHHGQEQTELLAWRIISMGTMAPEEPHLHLERRWVLSPTQFVGFDRAVVQRFLGLAGIIHHSHHQEYVAKSPLKAFRKISETAQRFKAL